MNKEAREERNAYQREWRKNHKELVKRHNAEYWKRRAEKRKVEQKTAQ